ncbi:MAG TPA: transposase [Spirochaetota bacterium]|nr:transposase [Spirochaetota bacterium]
MHTTQSPSENQGENTAVQDAITDFIAHFHIGMLLNRSGIRKVRGARPLDIITKLFSLPFLKTTLYWGIVRNQDLGYGKDAVYDIYKRSNFNWRALLLSLAAGIVRFFDPLTDTEREKVLILDDSPIERPRSKAVELLARVYDHSTKQFIRGFRFMCLTWSDGVSTAPLDFALLSSYKKKNRYQEESTTVDKRSCGYRRRTEARTKSTDLLESMVKRAIRAGIKANYILMDSWFAFPSIITKLSAHLPVICMLKRMKTVFYTWRGQKYTLEGLFQRVPKHSGKSRILASVWVTITFGKKEKTVKIVFVRDSRKSDWLALLSTNTELADTEVVRIYGKRWDIEVFFKMSKQYLQLESGVQIRNFDGLIAHITITLMRYLFLSYRQRCDSDDRTLGELFIAGCEELRDITLLEALHRILSLVADALRKTELTSEQFVQNLIDAIMGEIIQKMNLKPCSAISHC